MGQQQQQRLRRGWCDEEFHFDQRGGGYWIDERLVMDLLMVYSNVGELKERRAAHSLLYKKSSHCKVLLYIPVGDVTTIFELV